MNSTMLPLVTIAIPTYNRAASFLQPCLADAIGQTYPNIEIILADNQSTDATADLVQSTNAPNLRYFRHENGIAPNDNFNFCLAKARGDYFQLLQDDERIDPDFVETCLRAVEFSTQYGLIHTGIRTIDANGIVIGEAENRASATGAPELFLDWFNRRVSLYLCNTLFNRVCLLQEGGFKSRHNLFQDMMAQARVATRMPRAGVRAIKASTRQHGGQNTRGVKVRAWCEDSLDLLDLMCRLAPDDADEIRTRGTAFFARIGYSRASSIRNPIERAEAYRLVYRLFERRHLPPARMVLASTSAYRIARQLKRRVLGLPAWVDG